MAVELLTVEASRLKPGDKFIVTKKEFPYATKLEDDQEVEITVLEPRQDEDGRGGGRAGQYKWRFRYMCRREDTDKTGNMFFPKGQKLEITRGGTP